MYQTTTVVALDAATVPVTVRATSDQDGNGGVGAIGNAAPGDVLQFGTTVPNVASQVTVTSQSVTGADAEPVEEYRARILARFQRHPQGGASADYDQWALDVPGIVAVYPYVGDPGEVVVYVEADAASSGNADGIPTAAQLSAARLVGLRSRLMKDRRGLEIPVGDTLVDRADDTLVVFEVSDDVVRGKAASDGLTYTVRDTDAAWTILKRADGTSPGQRPPEVEVTKRTWWKFWG